MRKSGWAAAAGLGSLVLLLAACGGSSSSSSVSAAGSTSSSAPQSTAAASSSAAKTRASKATSKAPAQPNPTTGVSTPRTTAPGPQPSSSLGGSIPPVGTIVMIVERTGIGYVLAEASAQVVYTYSKGTKGGKPTCTGSCADTWLPVTGVPQAGPADTFPGKFALVTGAGGVKQVTYNGYPLYTLKGAKPYETTGNGVDGEWHVVPLSASDIA